MMNKKQLLHSLIGLAYEDERMLAPSEKFDGVFGIGVKSGIVVTLEAWSKDHDGQQAEIAALKTELANEQALAAGLGKMMQIHRDEVDALKADSKARCVKTDPPKRMRVVLVSRDGWDHPVLAYQSPEGHWTDSDGYRFDDGLMPTIWMPIPIAMVAAIAKAKGENHEN